MYFVDGQVFSADDLTSFSGKCLIFQLFMSWVVFHNLQGLIVTFNSDYIVCIFSKYSCSKCNVGLLNQNVMTSVKIYLHSRTCRVNCASAGYF